MSAYKPKMSKVGHMPPQDVEVSDEYQNQRTLKITEELPLTIYLDRYEIVTLMTLGMYPELLALGYIRNQYLLEDLHQIKSVQADWDVQSVAITTKLDKNDWSEKLGKRIVTSGCGQGTLFGHILEKLEAIDIIPFILKQSTLYQLLKNINAYNDVYRTSGSVHACALCDQTNPLIFIEDVGRHNAVDIIAGKMWLEQISGHDKIFYTTGRLTSEMVTKVAQMKIPILLSRSGITRMGLSIAKKLNITLLARVQNKHFLIYNGKEHIEFDVTLPTKLAVAKTSRSHH